MSRLICVAVSSTLYNKISVLAMQNRLVVFCRLE